MSDLDDAYYNGVALNAVAENLAKTEAGRKVLDEQDAETKRAIETAAALSKSIRGSR